MKVQDCQQTRYNIAAVGNIFIKPDPKEINCDILVLLGGMLPKECDTEGKVRAYLPEFANWINSLSAKEILFIFSDSDRLLYNISETVEYSNFISSLNKPFNNLPLKGEVRTINGKEYKLIGIDNINEEGSLYDNIRQDNEIYNKNQIIFSQKQAGLCKYESNCRLWNSIRVDRQIPVIGHGGYGGYATSEMIFRNACLHFYGDTLYPKQTTSHRYFAGNSNNRHYTIWNNEQAHHTDKQMFYGRTRFKTINSVYLTQEGNKIDCCGIYHCNLR